MKLASETVGRAHGRSCFGSIERSESIAALIGFRRTGIALKRSGIITESPYPVATKDLGARKNALLLPWHGEDPVAGSQTSLAPWGWMLPGI